MSKDRKMITLKSSDDQVFVVEKTVALESQTIKHMVEDACADNDIPILNVTGKILSMVIEYCKKHAEAVATGDNAMIEAFGSEFVKVDQATLFKLILAADYLNIKSLLNLTCQSVAEMIRGKYPWEIRKMFKIKNDFSLKEEDEIRRENAWAFE